MAAALGNLAELTAEGDPAAAEALFRQQLELRQRTLGEGHPAVASSLGALVRLGDLDGRSAEVEPLARRALEILEASLHPDHPALADALELVASLNESAGNTEQATTLLERVLRIREDSLGWSHPAVAPALDALAARGTTWTRAIAPSGWTLPSHVSVMTGVHPSWHGHVAPDRRHGPPLPTLA